MITVNNVSLRFGKRTLFEGVNLKFTPGNCYGIIGANGAGKSTFLKLLSGEIETTSGEINIGKDERISVLKQDHNLYNDYRVIDTVIMGNKRLYEIIEEKNFLYTKEPFTDKDGIKLGELESEFAFLNGWQAESDAAILLSGLGVDIQLHELTMKEIPTKEKVKVLLAQALFGNPDVLLLDEPTNGLDIEAKIWLEEFLINFENTILVVSHDRHFLNKVCTHIVDIDYEKITLFVGNYDFWYKSSELIQKQMRDSNKKKEEKIKELEDFIRRFSANASKSKQATSRKKSLEKIKLEDIKPSSRKYPYINFEIEKELGKEVVYLDNISYFEDDKPIIKDLTLTIRPFDKIALIGNNSKANSILLDIISGKKLPTKGKVSYGSTVKLSYFEKNNDYYFNEDISLYEWLRNFSSNKEETFVRGFLGRMLFSGDESLKSVKVLSGGEKVRSMLSKIMMEKPNVLLLDEPTNHLDIESITSLDEGMKKFKGAIVFTTYDQELIESVSNRLIEIKKDGSHMDRQITYQEYTLKYGIEEE